MHVKDLQAFLAELAENNNRAWFVMNKPRYDILRAEFLQMVTDLLLQIAKFDPLLAHADPRKALFRINRDVRFAADKSPYKTKFSAALVASGRKKPSEGGGPMYYFHLDEKGKLFYAAGEYMPPAERLLQIRRHIVADAQGFAAMLKNPQLQQEFGDLQRERVLQRPPKGFAADAQHIAYLKLKDYIVWREIELGSMDAQELLARLVHGFQSALALVQWLRSAQSLPA